MNLTKKEISLLNRGLLKGINYHFGIDFESDFIFRKIALPKTLNKIIKENKEIAENTYNYLLIKDKFSNAFKMVEFKHNEIFKIDVLKHFSMTQNIGTFRTKQCFKEYLKESSEAYLLIVNKKNKTQFENKKSQLNDFENMLLRLNTKKDIENEYIKNFEYSRNCYNSLKYIDKSGYYTYNKKEELRQKKYALKYQKAKKAIQNGEFNQDISLIENKLKHIKLKLKNDFNLIELSYKNFENFSKKIDRFKWVLHKYENFICNMVDINFNNINHIKIEIIEINKLLEEI